MSTELDLERGDEEEARRIAEEGAARSRRVRRSRSDSDSKSKSSSKTTTARKDTDLVGKLADAFSRLADRLGERGDDELSTAIREEKDGMAGGLVSLTRAIPVFRGPLLFFLNLLDPVLAFWRVGSILVGRFIERRARVMAEREAAAAGVSYEEPVAA